MSNAELREKAHKAIDLIPDHEPARFVSIMEEVKELLNKAEFDARVKRVIDENRGLLQHLAQ